MQPTSDSKRSWRSCGQRYSLGGYTLLPRRQTSIQMSCMTSSWVVASQ